MQISTNIIKRLLRKHRFGFTKMISDRYVLATQYIEDQFKIYKVLSSDVVITVPENLYFNSDYEYIQDAGYVKVTTRNSMITSSGVVMWQMASQGEYFIHRFTMVLDDSQYEYWFKMAIVLNEQSVKNIIDKFSKVVNNAHQTYVKNNEEFLPV